MGKFNLFLKSSTFWPRRYQGTIYYYYAYDTKNNMGHGETESNYETLMGHGETESNYETLSKQKGGFLAPIW